LALLRRLRLLSDIDDCIQHACDCSFLYFSRSDLLPILVRELSKPIDGDGVARIQLALAAVSDPERTLLSCSPHLGECLEGVNSNILVDSYRAYVIDGLLQEEFVKPICYEAETTLRLAMQSNDSSAVPLNPKLDRRKVIRPFLEIPPLNVMGRRIDLRLAVKEYLDETFYKLAILSPNDSKSYTEMRCVAKEIYALDVMEDGLPLSRHDQIFDLLSTLEHLDGKPFFP